MIQPRLIVASLSLLGVAAPGSLNAYELATHARVTHAAISRSVLSSSEFIIGLGIDPASLNPFGEFYYDSSSVLKLERRVYPFEARFMPLRAEETLSLQAWVLRGAIREDDYTGPDAPNPKDDPYNSSATITADERPLNHFYDPIGHRALTVGLALGERAPDWGLGTIDAMADPEAVRRLRRNHFTVRDAREAQYRALTGRGRNAQGREIDDIAPTQTERNKYWATTFRALGDVVHLIQDMAQPQHTRNDPHAGKRYDEPGGPLGLGGHKSTYEAYIEARATGTRFTTADRAALPKPLSLKTNDLSEVLSAPYPTPRFDDYLSFFTTRHKESGDFEARRGMADYTNRGFFSAGTNLGHNDFPSPVNNPSAYASTDLYVDWAGEPLGKGEKVSVLMGAVADSLPEGQSATNVPLTTFGAWDQFLTLANRPADYTLNRYNYDAMASLLLPRAVAYSAGVIDYFFRGRLEVQDAGFTETGVILRVKNAIDAKKTPAWAGEYLDNGGKLVATLRYELPNPSDPEHPEIKLFSSPPVTLEERVNPGKASKNAYTFDDLPEEAVKVEYWLGIAASCIPAFNEQNSRRLS